jgi:hypothetical protein
MTTRRIEGVGPTLGVARHATCLHNTQRAAVRVVHDAHAQSLQRAHEQRLDVAMVSRRRQLRQEVHHGGRRLLAVGIPQQRVDRLDALLVVHGGEVHNLLGMAQLVAAVAVVATSSQPQRDAAATVVALLSTVVEVDLVASDIQVVQHRHVRRSVRLRVRQPLCITHSHAIHMAHMSGG